jgi:hypothetical protein
VPPPSLCRRRGRASDHRRGYGRQRGKGGASAIEEDGTPKTQQSNCQRWGAARP